MKRTLHLEMSPGTITFGQCPKYSSDSCYSFLTVALGDDGVKPVGTIVSCTECEGT